MTVTGPSIATIVNRIARKASSAGAASDEQMASISTLDEWHQLYCANVVARRAAFSEIEDKNLKHVIQSILPKPEWTLLERAEQNGGGYSVAHRRYRDAIVAEQPTNTELAGFVWRLALDLRWNEVKPALIIEWRQVCGEVRCHLEWLDAHQIAHDPRCVHQFKEIVEAAELPGISGLLNSVLPGSSRLMGAIERAEVHHRAIESLYASSVEYLERMTSHLRSQTPPPDSDPGKRRAGSSGPEFTPLPKPPKEQIDLDLGGFACALTDDDEYPAEASND